MLQTSSARKSVWEYAFGCHYCGRRRTPWHRETDARQRGPQFRTRRLVRGRAASYKTLTLGQPVGPHFYRLFARNW